MNKVLVFSFFTVLILANLVSAVENSLPEGIMCEDSDGGIKYDT